MNDIINVLIESFQVRKTYDEKSQFIDWIGDVSEDLGYELKVESVKECRNLLIGDVESAELILTAHYDTQANAFIPMFMGMNWSGFILGQAYILLVFYLLFNLSLFVFTALGIPFGHYISLLIVIAYLYQFQYGIANKHTVNDNTSGVATLLTIMKNIGDEDRDRVAFVFFDQEELGLIGSKHFKNRHGKNISNTPLINFDCVANGDNLAFISRKQFRNSKLYDRLYTSIESEKQHTNKAFLIGDAIKYVYPSDQLHFKNSVAVAALKKAPLIGYYLNGIHNSRDMVFQEENIEVISNVILNLISEM